MARNRGGDRLQRQFQDRNFRAMTGGQQQRGYQAPEAMRRVQEAAEERYRIGVVAEPEVCRLSTRELRELRGWSNGLSLFAQEVIGRDACKQVASDLKRLVHSASYKGADFSDVYAVLVGKLDNKGSVAHKAARPDYEEWVVCERKIVVKPSPAVLSEVAKAWPKEIAFMRAVAEQAGVEIADDDYEGPFDITLCFGYNRYIQETMVGLSGGEDTIPALHFLDFCAQRVRRSPYVMSRHMASLAISPISRKVKLD
jgi:hypothetical protein